MKSAAAEAAERAKEKKSFTAKDANDQE